MDCPICNVELVVVGGNLKNLVPAYVEGNIFPNQISVTIETEYNCTICNLTIAVPEIKSYIQEV